MKRFALPFILCGSLLFLTTGCNDDNGSNGEDLQIFENVEDDSNLSTLRDAITAAGLDSLLLEDGPFTLFAPNNSAFDQLPEGVLDSLLQDSTTLRDLLLYHVTEEELSSSEITELDSITTALGEQITVTVENGNVLLNDSAQVVDADKVSNNGTIHVINEVLVPESIDLEDFQPAQ